MSQPQIPVTPDEKYSIDSAREQLTKLLSRRWIESISFPGPDNTTIILHGKRDSFLLQAEVHNGKFIGFNAHPVI